MVLPGLTDLHTLLPGQNKPVPLPVIGHMILLQPGAGRQKNVGQFGGGGLKKINNGQKFDLLQGLVGLLGVGPGDTGLVPPRMPAFSG